MTLGEKIRKMREEKAYTIAEFAQKLQVDTETVQLLEQDQLQDPDVDLLNGVADLLEMTVEDVFDINTPEMAKALGLCKAGEDMSKPATGMVSRIGQCIYCGQQAMVTCSDEATQNEVDLFVTHGCNCDGAKKQRQKEEAEQERRRKIEMAEYNVQTLIGDEHPDAGEIMMAAIPYLVDCDIKKVTISIEEGLQATISRDTYSKVTVEKKRTIVDTADSE